MTTDGKQRAAQTAQGNVSLVSQLLILKSLARLFRNEAGAVSNPLRLKISVYTFIKRRGDDLWIAC